MRPVRRAPPSAPTWSIAAARHERRSARPPENRRAARADVVRRHAAGHRGHVPRARSGRHAHAPARRTREHHASTNAAVEPGSSPMITCQKAQRQDAQSVPAARAATRRPRPPPRVRRGSTTTSAAPARGERAGWSCQNAELSDCAGFVPHMHEALRHPRHDVGLHRPAERARRSIHTRGFQQICPMPMLLGRAEQVHEAVQRPERRMRAADGARQRLRPAAQPASARQPRRDVVERHLPAHALPLVPAPPLA